MDLETENRIAAILLKEAAELRRQAQSEGALAYLRQPTVRSRPNSRFLTATVRGVQQANRAVEVNEMWRIRDKQLELENRLHFRNKSSRRCSYNGISEHRRSKCSGSNDVETSKSSSFSLKERHIRDLDSVDEGLRDDEVDEFLQSRTKRGRGAVGSRMDETGPYLSYPDSEMNVSEISDVGLKKARVVLGPEKPCSLICSGSSDDEPSHDKKRSKKSSSKLHSSKSKSKHKLRDKKKQKSEKRSKHHK